MKDSSIEEFARTVPAVAWRSHAGANVEVREASGSDQSPLIGGHGAVFNQLSDDLGGFRERIQPGAFKRTLKSGADVRVLLNHDPNYVLGRTKSGTATVSEDLKGLAYQVSPPDTQWARDLLVTMKRGDINQSSFQFRVVKDKWAEQDGVLIRDVHEAHLFDVSPVTFPAYPGADSKQIRALYRRAARAAWTAAYINNLPDSAFAYIESGGEKDDEGKTTPRNLRHFPHHDAEGNVDLAHLRNALSRAPQSPFGDKALPHLEKHAAAEDVGSHSHKHKRAVEGSYEDLQDDLEDAAEELLACDECELIATFADRVIVFVAEEPDEDPDDGTYWEIPYTLDDAGDPHLGSPVEMDMTFTPAERSRKNPTRAGAHSDAKGSTTRAGAHSIAHLRAKLALLAK